MFLFISGINLSLSVFSWNEQCNATINHWLVGILDFVNYYVDRSRFCVDLNKFKIHDNNSILPKISKIKSKPRGWSLKRMVYLSLCNTISVERDGESSPWKRHLRSQTHNWERVPHSPYFMKASHQPPHPRTLHCLLPFVKFCPTIL